MPEITTLDNLKTHLDITDTSEDVLLTQLLNEIEAVIFSYTGRPSFASASATEYYDGTGREVLILDRTPVTAVTSLYVDGDGYYGQGSSPFESDTAWTQGTDFAIRRVDESEENAGILLALGSIDFQAPATWPVGRGNIKVTYTAGYTAIPKDLELAAHLLAGQVYKMAEKGMAGPVGGETFGEYSYNLLSNASVGGLEMMTLRSILGRYRKVAL